VKKYIFAGIALAIVSFLAACSSVPDAAPGEVQVTIHADQPGPTINPNIYGQFAELIGAKVYISGNVGSGTVKEAAVLTRVNGAQVQNASGRVLTAPAIDSHNTVNAPDTVKPAPIEGEVRDGAVFLRLPPRSVTVVALQ